MPVAPRPLRSWIPRDPRRPRAPRRRGHLVQRRARRSHRGSPLIARSRPGAPPAHRRRGLDGQPHPHGATGAGSDSRTSRRVTEQTRAEVFLRDGFICTYCGGRTIPRCILVAISDVFPDAFPYYAHYRRGTVHPAYWALAPEADHVLAHANGGTSDAADLTTLHAMCNTRKSSLGADSLPTTVSSPARDAGWDGLLSRYASIVGVGETTGRRHSAAGYHQRWLGLFEIASGMEYRAQCAENLSLRPSTSP